MNKSSIASKKLSNKKKKVGGEKQTKLSGESAEGNQRGNQK
jgi:hypothetical protein